MNSSKVRKALESPNPKSQHLMDLIIEEQIVEITKSALEEEKPWVDIIKGNHLVEIGRKSHTQRQ